MKAEIVIPEGYRRLEVGEIEQRTDLRYRLIDPTLRPTLKNKELPPERFIIIRPIKKEPK